MAWRIFGVAMVGCCLWTGALLTFFSSANTIPFVVSLLAGIFAILTLALYTWLKIAGRHTTKLLHQLQVAQSETSETQRMLASMSHEIRTPLNGVIGMINLMLGSPLSAEQRNYAQTADASGRTLLSIIDEILDTAKGNATRGDRTRGCDIRETVQSVTELLAARAHAKGIELSAHVDTDVPAHINMDDTQLRQVLFNLAGNAIKFTHNGGVAIDIDLRDGTTLEITVSDSGIGMTEAEQRRIFEDYRQANGSTHQVYGGTGLGLGITRRIVGQYGGTIAVASTVGLGSRFSITVPLTQPLPAPPSHQTAVLAGRHFVLAMTDGVSATHLARTLDHLGAQVSRVASASELRRQLALRDHTVSIIADTSHATTLRRWGRADAKRGQSAVQNAVWIMLTPEERRNYPDLLSAPFAGYLLKPLRVDSVLRLLTRHDALRVSQAVNDMRSLVKDSVATSLRVLIADDNPVNLLLTRTMLQKSGHKVTAVTNGQEVLTVFGKKSGFDVVLLDVEMPVLDGHATARRLRQIEKSKGRHRPVPILALTAHMRQEDLQKCLASGMNDYLSKPFDQLDLMDAIAAVMQVAGTTKVA